MSQGNVGWVREAAEAWERGDMDRVEAVFEVTRAMASSCTRCTRPGLQGLVDPRR